MMNRQSAFLSGLLIALLASFLSFPRLAAQTPSGKLPAITFRTLGVDCAPEGLQFLSGTNTISLPVSQDMRSMPLTYAGESPLVLFRTIPGDDGRKTNIPVLSVDISNSGSFPLLVFFKGATDTAPPKVKILPEDASSFPGGTYRVFNNTAFPLLVAFGSAKLTVPPFAIGGHKAESEVITLEVNSLEPAGPRKVMRSNVGMLAPRRILILANPTGSPETPVELQRHYDTAPSH